MGSIAHYADIFRRLVFVILCLVLVMYNFVTLDDKPRSVPIWHTVLEVILTLVFVADVAWRFYWEKGNFWASKMNIVEVLVAAYCVISLAVSVWYVRDMDDAALTVRFVLQLSQALTYVRPMQQLPPIGSIFLSVFSDATQYHPAAAEGTVQTPNAIELTPTGEREEEREVRDMLGVK